MKSPLTHNLTATFPRCATLVFACLTLATTSAIAQTKTTGDGKCGKPDLQSIDVGDRAGHALALVKFTCTWTGPFEIAGLKTKDYTGAAVSDMMGERSQDRGYVVVTMDNGDKAFIRYSGSGATAKDGAMTGQGTWSYTGGAGKLRGITGKGTYTSTGNADGSQDHVEGDYTLPPPPAPKAKAKK